MGNSLLKYFNFVENHAGWNRKPIKFCFKWNPDSVSKSILKNCSTTKPNIIILFGSNMIIFWQNNVQPESSLGRRAPTQTCYSSAKRVQKFFHNPNTSTAGWETKFNTFLQTFMHWKTSAYICWHLLHKMALWCLHVHIISLKQMRAKSSLT